MVHGNYTKSIPVQNPGGSRVKLPRYWREGVVEVRPFPAKKRPSVSEALRLSGEAVKRNPTTTVIPGVDKSKPSLFEDLTEPKYRIPLLLLRTPV